MAITYNPQQKRFERDGVPVSNEELRTLIDRLTLQTKREARRLSDRLERGEITRDAWLVAMATLLRASHVVAASVGSGGYNRVTEERWRKVEKKVTWQFGFLGKFSAAIAAGTVIGAISSRAVKYASAVFVTFSNAFQEAQTEGKDEKEMLCLRELHAQESCPECEAYADMGWIPVSEQPEIGSLQCSDYCKCTIIFQDEL